ncbi:hypothetical protein [Microbacterium imperiale]|uniref:Uncharacterized protein n=1 Tax=Microbacterium imperiale TaxID=33884 RepID=A0A9W6HE73_9MICO|nr:hypothetical protein [Microbacterium imperiale]MBP2420000.1 hypothetical protein [Microbacterium imperiale]MDS0198136.1 hypothetical protein [Microbacterium imperiale]BFE40342.1 hypothetical protein GCM10017544_12980 [Microbacterium imperiale]GLJ78682.1 hypothetical protein GCM10017586_03640 [Microbacterium imperiale]
MAARKRGAKPKSGEIYRQDRYGNKHRIDDAAAAAEQQPAAQPALPPAN